MNLFRAPGNVSRTFKNLGRIRQISGVFAKYGFHELMGKLGFGKFIPRKYRSTAAVPPLTAPERLRLALEELGPTFIKLGQILSSRSDLLPENFVLELEKLQDRVSPLPFTVIKNSVERELRTPLEEIFSSFDETPLASASIGQVHSAKLKDGRDVVVKVQRPGVDTLIKTDISVLTALAAAVEKYFPETAVLAPQTCVEEFFHAMNQETDFILEANNMIKSRENFKSIPEIYVPEVFLSLSTQKVLVIEKIEGTKLDQSAALDAQGLNRKALAETLAKAFLKSALEDGFFHGDLHMGNLFALPSSRLGLIDFGIMGHLTPRARESLLRIFVALSEEDFESLCMEYAELGTARGRTDFDSFQRNIQGVIAPYLGLPLSSLNAGKVLIDATQIAAKHQIRIPREWMLIFRGLYTLEGTCRKLDPTFNAIPLLEEYLAPMLKPHYDWDQFSKDVVLGTRDFQHIAQFLPRQLHWFFKRLAANGYALELKTQSSDEDRAQSEMNHRRLASAILSATGWIGGSYLMSLHLEFQENYLLAGALVSLGLALFLGRKALR